MHDAGGDDQAMGWALQALSGREIEGSGPSSKINKISLLAIAAVDGYSALQDDFDVRKIMQLARFFRD